MVYPFLGGLVRLGLFKFGLEVQIYLLFMILPNCFVCWEGALLGWWLGSKTLTGLINVNPSTLVLEFQSIFLFNLVPIQFNSVISFRLLNNT